LSFQPGSIGPLPIAVHPPLLRELVGNLIDNALKYSPPGTAVAVGAGTDGESIVLSVEDRGPGIPPADLPHVFEPFFRSARATGVPGSGLGLAVVARIAVAFGGRVAAENRPDGGARVTATFPAAPAASQAEEKLISPSRPL
jgi:signal transduction histidine kinase